MKKKHVSLIGLYYQGKDSELLEVLNSVKSPLSIDKDDKEESLSVDANEQDRYGNSILNLALRDENKKLARALWRAGADEMKKDDAKRLPLFSIIKQRYTDLAIDMVSAMIPDGVATDFLNQYEEYRDKQGLLHRDCAFGIAVMARDLRLCNVMMKAGANPLMQHPFTGYTPLYEMASLGDIRLVRAMLEFVPSNADRCLLENAISVTQTREIRDMIKEKLKSM